MSHSPKLEVLGQISERAREIESAVAELPGEYFAAQVGVAAAHTRDADWPQMREALILAASTAVNWLLSGDGDGAVSEQCDAVLRLPDGYVLRCQKLASHPPHPHGGHAAARELWWT